ncbi:MAG: serine/threonine-protein kinase, partial [Planctomycetota bacterium]
MSESLEKLKDQLIALVDGDPAAVDTDAEDLGTLGEAARGLPKDFVKPAWSFADPVEQRPAEIGPYRVVDVLGSGGMGVVYRVEQPQPLQRMVALKVVHRALTSKKTLARFELERAALARLSHPNIATVYDTGTCQRGEPFVAMELVEGLPINEYVRKNRLGIVSTLNLFQALCCGVAHAHACGIIHRDLKPSNVLVTSRDGKAIPKIIDFGIARILDSETETRLTLTDQVVGTLEYISPEVIELGAGQADARSDVYGLGAILYEMLTGTVPIDLDADKDFGVLKALQWIREATIESPSRRLKTLGIHHRLESDLDSIVLHALEKEPSQRYQSPIELSEDIDRYLNHLPIKAKPPRS